MKRLLLVALGVGFASYSSATIFVYTAALNGFEQVPQVPSPGIANVVLQLNDVNQTLSGTGTVQFLLAPPSGFHLHNGAFGANGVIVVDIGTSAISGNTINFSNVAVANFATVKANMDARNTYLNIHTTLFPGGEIRGQVAPVPEPATLGALGLGVAAFIRRRRK
jgi:hypothetical protein